MKSTPTLAALALLAGALAPVGATTLVRSGLADLVSSHPTIVVGEVIDAVSYWNDDGSFILTDVRIATNDTLKGVAGPGEVTVTILGGTVGDLTTLILGGAELVPGRSYLLFLDHEDLPAAEGVLTISEHCQGVFEIDLKDDELRAVSQANGHPLVPDSLGYIDAPGGVEGFPLDALIQTVRRLAARPRLIPGR